MIPTVAATEARRVKDITAKDIERWESLDWSEDTKRRLNISDDMPLDLQYSDLILQCSPEFRTNHGDIPNNSIVFLFDENGTIGMGWDPGIVNPIGKFAHDGAVYPATPGFNNPNGLHPIRNVENNFNKFCFIVVLEDNSPTPRAGIALRNPNVEGQGASVGDLYHYWELAAAHNVETSYVHSWILDDIVSDNSGLFNQKLRYQSMRSFARLLKQQASR